MTFWGERREKMIPNGAKMLPPSNYLLNFCFMEAKRIGGDAPHFPETEVFFPHQLSWIAHEFSMNYFISAHSWLLMFHPLSSRLGRLQAIFGFTSVGATSKSLEGQRRRVTRGNVEESCGATSLPIGKVLANSALVAPKAVWLRPGMAVWLRPAPSVWLTPFLGWRAKAAEGV